MIANVTPVFRQGSLGDPGNYRPVNSVPDIGRNYNKNRIHCHIEKQDGFCEGRSCWSFLRAPASLRIRAVQFDIGYLDFQKALDKSSTLKALKEIRLARH